jgi:hypothetical protein
MPLENAGKTILKIKISKKKVTLTFLDKTKLDITYHAYVENYLYENKNRIPFHEIMIIETPEEYTGESVAICVQNSTYYLPDRILTDEECLQIIDMNHKANYSIDKIAYEVIMGLRTHYPGYENE